MSSHFRPLASWLLGHVPTLLVLGGLAALFVWGAATDWQLSAMFPSLARAEDRDPDKRPASPPQPHHPRRAAGRPRAAPPAPRGGRGRPPRRRPPAGCGPPRRGAR